MTGVDEFLPFALPDIGEDEVEAVAEAMRSGWLTSGPSTAAFEQEFAEFLGGDVHAVAINSATAGLHLALEALGVGPGDEVIVPTWTFTATAEVVRYLGAHPVIVDVDPETLNIDLDLAAAAITPLTKAIMPVHFAGLAVDREGIAKLAEKNGLKVVEDAAHAFEQCVRPEVEDVGDLWDPQAEPCGPHGPCHGDRGVVDPQGIQASQRAESAGYGRRAKGGVVGDAVYRRGVVVGVERHPPHVDTVEHFVQSTPHRVAGGDDA